MHVKGRPYACQGSLACHGPHACQGPMHPHTPTHTNRPSDYSDNKMFQLSFMKLVSTCSSLLIIKFDATFLMNVCF